VVAAIGCSSDKNAAPTANDPNGSGGIVAGSLQVSAKAPTLSLKNQTEFKVGYLVVGQNVMTVASVPPCTNCAELKQGEAVSIPYASITGYSTGMPMARVIWWKWVPGARGLEVSGLTEVGVELK